jgi:succinyl-diaminopimelate desuccinylase
LKEFLGDVIEEADDFNVVDWAPSAQPRLTDPRIQALVDLTGQPALGKVGWTDVATFQELAVPSTNFGAGDPLLAHRSDEFVTLAQLDEFARVLGLWLN